MIRESSQQDKQHNDPKHECASSNIALKSIKENLTELKVETDQ